MKQMFDQKKQSLIFDNNLTLDAVQNYIGQGGTFDAQARNANGYTEAMFIIMQTGFAGMKLFNDNGGLFNADARTKMGESEERLVKSRTGLDGLRLFRENLAKQRPEFSRSNAPIYARGR